MLSKSEFIFIVSEYFCKKFWTLACFFQDFIFSRQTTVRDTSSAVAFMNIAIFQKTSNECRFPNQSGSRITERFLLRD
jgi:hypothetical protein